MLKTKGIIEDRLQLWWVSAAEAKRFAQKATEMSDLVLKLSEDRLASASQKVGVQPRSQI